LTMCCCAWGAAWRTPMTTVGTQEADVSDIEMLSVLSIHPPGRPNGAAAAAQDNRESFTPRAVDHPA
jgi:hypothetical protein